MTVDSPVGVPAGAAGDAAPASPSDQAAQAPVSRKVRRERRRAEKLKARRSRRTVGYFLMRFLRKAWIPLVILLVVGIAAFAVDRLHGVFGKTELTREGSGLANDPEPFNPKVVTYEIFGPPGTVATVNYLDLDAAPQIARDVTLPWTLTLTTTAPAAGATIVAQGDSDTIGCRITIDGELKDERTSTGVNAQTFCLVKSG